MSSDRNALDDLKRQWEQDPCWDLETTEGYEWAHDELLEHRILKQAEWAAEREATFAAEHRRAKAFGRTPVAATGGIIPVVICRDGSVWELRDVGRALDSGEDGDVERSPGRWVQLPSIPGSVSDLAHDFWVEGGDK